MSLGRDSAVVAVPALLAPLAVLLARIVQTRLPLTVLSTLAVYPVMAALLIRGRRKAALVAVLLWAFTLSVAIISATRRDPGSMERVVVNGPAYRDEMFGFVRTGIGTESDPSRFVPQHMMHFAAFSLLAVATAGLLGLALGAVMVAYMSFYVGALAAAGGAPSTAFLLGWPPWAILRVIGFVIIGIALSEPLLRRAAGGFGWEMAAPGSYKAWYVVGGSLLVADIVLKTLFAPVWASVLRPCLGS
jgi:hypothetical protein